MYGSLGLPRYLSWWRICLQCRRTQFNSWVGKIPWRRDKLPTSVLLGFPHGSESTESAYNAEDLGSVPELVRSPRGGHGNPLQYSSLENPHGQRSLVGYSPWSCRESDMTEQVSTAQLSLALLGSSQVSAVKNLPAEQETPETWVWSLGQKDSL